MNDLITLDSEDAITAPLRVEIFKRLRDAGVSEAAIPSVADFLVDTLMDREFLHLAVGIRARLARVEAQKAAPYVDVTEGPHQGQPEQGHPRPA